MNKNKFFISKYSLGCKYIHFCRYLQVFRCFFPIDSLKREYYEKEKCSANTHNYLKISGMMAEHFSHPFSDGSTKVGRVLIMSY
jgi:hypothetical protein